MGAIARRLRSGNLTPAQCRKLRKIKRENKAYRVLELLAAAVSVGRRKDNGRKVEEARRRLETIYSHINYEMLASIRRARNSDLRNTFHTYWCAIRAEIRKCCAEGNRARVEAHLRVGMSSAFWKSRARRWARLQQQLNRIVPPPLFVRNKSGGCTAEEVKKEFDDLAPFYGATVLRTSRWKNVPVPAIGIITPPMVLEGLNFGKFFVGIRVPPNIVDYFKMGDSGLRDMLIHQPLQPLIPLEARRGKWLKGKIARLLKEGNLRIHPHISGTRCCLGSANTTIKVTLREGRFFDAVRLGAWAVGPEAYHPPGAYSSLTVWRPGYHCQHCSTLVTTESDDYTLPLCGGCGRGLGYCEACLEKVGSCSGCGGAVCPACARSCRAAGDPPGSAEHSFCEACWQFNGKASFSTCSICGGRHCSDHSTWLASSVTPRTLGNLPKEDKRITEDVKRRRRLLLKALDEVVKTNLRRFQRHQCAHYFGGALAGVCIICWGLLEEEKVKASFDPSQGVLYSGFSSPKTIKEIEHGTQEERQEPEQGESPENESYSHLSTPYR